MEERTGDHVSSVLSLLKELEFWNMSPEFMDQKPKDSTWNVAPENYLIGEEQAHII